MNPSQQTDEIVYPDSDGRRMAENTLQAEWIMTIFGNLELLFAGRADVFVAMDNLWYPVKGKPKRRVAPDVYVVFGRPKGRRGSYKQWLEGGVPLHVVFEVTSPGNRIGEMVRKLNFYEKYGVDEYYVIDPDRHQFDVWHRVGRKLREVPVDGTLVSPRLGIRFNWTPGDDLTPPTDVVLRHPDGREFLTYLELGEERDRTERERERIERERDRIEQELAAMKERADVFAAKLRELGLDPDTIR